MDRWDPADEEDEGDDEDNNDDEDDENIDDDDDEGDGGEEEEARSWVSGSCSLRRHFHSIQSGKSVSRSSSSRLPADRTSFSHSSWLST